MPVYCYSCKDCDHVFETRHSMSFESQKCVSCGSGNVFKIPSLSLFKAEKTHSRRVGKVVDDYIKDAKQEIKDEKNRLKREEL